MNQQQFSEWKQLPETKAFFRYLWHARLYAMEEWARRTHLLEDMNQASIANAMALGGVKVLDSMLEVTHEDIEHFNEITGGVGEFRYPTRREPSAQGSEGVGAAGQAGPG